MGMYTAIIHPKDGRELQIKTGDMDICDTYKVGDKVSFYVNKNIYEYGGIFDGVYDSYSDKGEDDWVIIKNKKVIAVRSKKNKYIALVKQYKIKTKPSKKLWAEKSYKRYVAQQKKLEIENKKFDKSIEHLTPQEKLAACIARPLKERMDYGGIMRKVLKIREIV